MKQIAIKMTGIKKSFKVGSGATSLKQTVLGILGKKDAGHTTQAVLRGIDIEIYKGDFFGIVGRNGEGKSTLLKILAGVYRPSAGEIWINGKLTPFIELGVGFNPELTGRDNVFLNGALLGFTHKQMESLYDDIVEFSELREYMDRKLKNFSSGMQVRLAFSIAIKAKNEILIFDEVLAVGDEAFQRKCLGIFEEYKANGQTVILVTHDMGTVRQYCNRAALLSKGEMIKVGDPNEVATAYSELNGESINKNIEEQNTQANSKSLIKIEILHDKKTSFSTGDTLKVKLSWPDSQSPQYVGLSIVSSAGVYVFGTNTHKRNIDLKNKTHIEYEVKLDLGAGKYHFSAGIYGRNMRDTIYYCDSGPGFLILPNPKDLNIGGIARLLFKYK